MHVADVQATTGSAAPTCCLTVLSAVLQLFKADAVCDALNAQLVVTNNGYATHTPEHLCISSCNASNLESVLLFINMSLPQSANIPFDTISHWRTGALLSRWRIDTTLQKVVAL